MKRIFSTWKLSVLLLIAINGNAQNVTWAIQEGGSGNDRNFAVAVDKSKNIISAITNISSSTTTFDGQCTITGGTSYYDATLSKLDSGKNCTFSKYIIKDLGEVRDMAVDTTSNVYVTGYYYYAQSLFCNSLAAGSYYNAFVAKYNSSGTCQWSVKFGGTGGNTYGYGIKADASGNVYVTGQFQGTVSFGSTNLTAAGTSDGFVVKLNSSGTVQWAKRFGGSGAVTGAYGISNIVNGLLYLTGYFTSTITFGSYGDTSNASGSSNNAYLAKLDTSGNFYWATKGGGTNGALGLRVYQDNGSNIFLTGTTVAGSTFGSGVTSSDSSEFIARYNSSGQIIWLKNLGGESIATTGSTGAQPEIAIYDSTIYFGGSLGRTTTFGGYTLTDAGGADAYICKLDYNGKVLWAENFGGSSNDVAFAIGCDQSGYAYLSGFFSGTVSFGGTSLTSSGSSDVFVAKIISGITVDSIASGLNQSCAGSQFNVKFNANETFNSGNVFTAQLSDSSGNFGSPLSIGTLTSISSGVISCDIPNTVSAGSNYRIRIIGSNPSTTGEEYAWNFKLISAPSPTVDNQAVCAGNSATLSASGGGTYNWSTGATTSSITVSTAGAYTVTVTNSSGCTASVNDTFTVHTLPTPTVTTDTICSGSTATMTASGGTHYLWSNTDTTASFTTGTAGTYSVTATNVYGCSATASGVVIVHSLPSPSVNNDTICSGDTATLTATGGSTYLWSTSATTSSITATVAGTYTVTATNANGCTAMASGIMVTKALPSPSVTNDTVCSGDTATLAATGGVSYIWSTSATTSSITATGAGVYTVTATNSSGCTATASGTVIINSNPVVNVNSPIIYPADTAILTATGGANYVWSTGDTTTSISEDTAGTYTVTATNISGCTASASGSVTINNTPPPTMTFEFNKGQYHNDTIKYLAHNNDMLYRFLSDGVSFARIQPDTLVDSTYVLVWNMKLNGIGSSCTITGQGAGTDTTVVDSGIAVNSTGIINYYIGNDSTKWFSNIPTFGSLLYTNVYDSIDLRYYTASHQGVLEYDFIINPGGKTSSIKMQYSGIDSLQIDSIGNANVFTKMGEVTEMKPVAYQIIGGNNVNVPVSFSLDTDGVFGFTLLASYDTTQPLIIDPYIQLWSTYWTPPSTTGSNVVSSMSADASGVYVGGRLDYFSLSQLTTDYPVANSYYGIFTPAFGSDYTFVAYTAKFNLTATTKIWTTIFGGVNEGTVASTPEVIIGMAQINDIYDLKTDASLHGGIVTGIAQNIYVCGSTLMTDFPHIPLSAANLTTGTNNEGDAFLAMFNASNGQAAYINEFGGSENDAALKLSLDNQTPPDVFMTGFTQSNDLLPSGWYYNSSSPSRLNEDIFMVELNPSTPTGGYITGLNWGSYATTSGAINMDWGHDIIFNPSNSKVYVTGFVNTGNTTNGFPVTSHGGERAPSTSNRDGFFTSLTPGATVGSPATVEYSTAIGGADADDEIFSMDLDASGDIHLLGITGQGISAGSEFTVTNPSISYNGGTTLTYPWNSSGALPLGGPGDSYVSGFLEILEPTNPYTERFISYVDYEVNGGTTSLGLTNQNGGGFTEGYNSGTCGCTPDHQDETWGGIRVGQTTGKIYISSLNYYYFMSGSTNSIPYECASQQQYFDYRVYALYPLGSYNPTATSFYEVFSSRFGARDISGGLSSIDLVQPYIVENPANGVVDIYTGFTTYDDIAEIFPTTGPYTVMEPPSGGNDNKSVSLKIELEPVETLDVHIPICSASILAADPEIFNVYLASGINDFTDLNYSWTYNNGISTTTMAISSGPLHTGFSEGTPWVFDLTNNYGYGTDATYTITITARDAVTLAVCTLEVVNFIVTIVSSTTTSITPSPACLGGQIASTTSADIGATPGPGNTISYTWSTGETTQSITPTLAGTYFVTVTVNDSYCSATASVIVNPSPTASISSSATTICSGSTATLTASGGGTYLWSPGGGTTAGINASATGVYTVTVTNSYGCSSDADVSVTVNPVPTPTVNNETICSGSSATLSVSGVPSGSTYLWNDPSSSTTASITPTPSTTATYTVTVTDVGCTATASGTVTVNPLPSISLPSTYSTCVSPLTISPTITPTATYTYTWALDGTPIGATSSTYSTTATGTYSLTVESSSVCSATASTSVSFSLPVIDISVSVSNSTPCEGDDITFTYLVCKENASCTDPDGYTIFAGVPSQLIYTNYDGSIYNNFTITAGLESTGLTDASFSSMTGCVTLYYTARAATAGTYSETPAINNGYLMDGGTNLTGTVTPVSVTVNSTPELYANAGGPFVIYECSTGSITLGGTTSEPTASGGSGSYTYTWSGGLSGVANPTVTLPIGTPPVTYTVTVSDASTTCVATSTATISEPSNGFTEILDGGDGDLSVTEPREVSDMVSDDYGNIYAVGSFFGNIFLQHTPPASGTNYYNPGKSSPFIAKYNPCDATLMNVWDYVDPYNYYETCTTGYTPFDNSCVHPYNHNVCIDNPSASSPYLYTCISGQWNGSLSSDNGALITKIPTSTNTPVFSTIVTGIFTTDIESDPDGNIYVAGYNCTSSSVTLTTSSGSTTINAGEDFIGQLSTSASSLTWNWVTVPVNSSSSNMIYSTDGILSLGTYNDGTSDYLIVSSGLDLAMYAGSTGTQIGLTYSTSPSGISYPDRTSRIAVYRSTPTHLALLQTGVVYLFNFTTTGTFSYLSSATLPQGLGYDLKADPLNNVYVMSSNLVYQYYEAVSNTLSLTGLTSGLGITSFASTSTTYTSYISPDNSGMDRCLTFDDNFNAVSGGNSNLYIGGSATPSHPITVGGVTFSSFPAYGYITRINSSDGGYFFNRPSNTDTVDGLTQRTQIGSISIFPNPFTDELNFIFNSATKMAKVDVYDMTGRIVKERTLNINGGLQQSMDLSSLPAAPYLVKVVTDSETITKNMIKLRY